MVEIVQLSFSHSSLIINIILITAFILNLIFAFIIIFMERRSAGSIWAWLLVLVFLPIVGFILYLLLGRQIQRKHIFKLKKENRKGLAMIVDEQLNALEKDDFSKGNHQIVKFKEMVHMLLYNNAAFLTTDNSIKIFTDGHAKFDALIEDIQNAKDYIHIQYYIFKSDGLGRRILKALEDRLEDGIEVKMLYDDMGSRTLRKKDLKQFKDKGGRAEAFFPSKLPSINLRMNNRNHRKIVIIDGKIGYVGGFNVGDEYLGKDKKFGYWRDTHLRLEGDSVNALELRFILDWNSQSTRDNISYEDRYFPDVDSGGEIGVQIASSGPDEDWEQIKYGYLKMIMSAHSKTLIVDDEIATVGTANMDNRSFTLNFEVNAFIYDEDISLQLKKAFIKDMKVSYELTKELYNQRSTWIKFKEGISQLLSPIL